MDLYMHALFACCRLRAGARADKSDSQTSRRTEPYTSMQEFSDELDKFGSFYKVLRKDPNESEEASIMRLAETLSGNSSVLKVSCLLDWGEHCNLLNISQGVPAIDLSWAVFDII